MHTLLFTLQDHDLGHLKIIAEYWGFELPSEPSLGAAEWLSTAMLDEMNILEITESLPKTARKALDDLLQQGGQTPFSDFARRYGMIRDMGEGRRDRIKPWRNPISALEILWYRGLVARAFKDTPKGAQEFIFIPSDLLQYLPAPISSVDFIPGEEVSSPKHIELTSNAAVNDVTTLLASLRKDPISLERIQPSRYKALIPFLLQPQSLDLILTILSETKVLTSQPIQPQPDQTRLFLERTLEQATGNLLLSWRDSVKWNDLQHVDGIVFGGEKWPNDPMASRFAVLNFLRLIPCGKWWGLESFILAIHEQYPSFLRPAGDFDSWYLQDSKTEVFLRGFDHWHDIDGALIRYIITGPLHHLGATDLGAEKPGEPYSAFRLTSLSNILFDSNFQVEHEESTTPISIFLDGKIIAPISSQQSHRYQIARFCDWLDLTKSGYRYRISPSALQRAADQELSIKHIKSILERASEETLPPSLLEALSHWETRGEEAHIEKTLVLRVKDPQLLDKLLSNYSVARFLQERIGPTTVVVLERDLEKIYSAVTRLGILIDSL